MNYRLLARLLGIITGAIGLAFVLCLGVAWHYYHGGDVAELAAIHGFALSAGIAGILTMLLEFLGRKARRQLFNKEALAIIGLGWTVATVIGALPYFFIVPYAGFVDGIFESASGFTTTGASIFRDVEVLQHSVLFWRSLSQWIGGLGVVVFFVAILSFLGAGAKILFSNESSAQAADLGSERVQTGVSRILRLYLALSVICTLAFYATGMGFFDAVNHMCTTLSTGGFSNHNASIGYYNSPLVEWVCIVFMAIGGTSFILILRFVRGERRILRKNTEFRAYYGIILAATFICAAFNYFDGQIADIHGAVRHSCFTVVSLMTTTGFATQDFDKWLPVLHMVLLAVMIIGGCAGSTSGGVKVVRAVTAWKYAGKMLEKSFRLNVVRTIRINGQPLSGEDCEESNGFLVVTFLIMASGMILMAHFEPHMSLEGTISSVIACLFNVGPGFAEVGPTHCYADLHIASKYLLSLLMVMGRVELFAILALFAPSLWRKF
jgi:trk system potassium uptake protein TrkH